MSSDAQILVVIRASPVRERTAALVQSIVVQQRPDLVKCVVLSPRGASSRSGFGPGGIDLVAAEFDWMAQVAMIAAASGCRWLVLPSSADRYYAGAFEAVAEVKSVEGQTVVGPCEIAHGGKIVRVGPEPFCFDYFALLSGFSYIAPGATFIDIRRWCTEGGFDPRFPSAPTYEFLLRTGAAQGVEVCPLPLLETEAEPFPGVPADWAPLYATDVLSVTLNYNRFFVTPGALLGLMAVLGDHLAPYRFAGFHDEAVLRLLDGAGPPLRERYLANLGLRVGPEAPPKATVLPQLGLHNSGLRSQLKAVTPRPLWDILRRSKRAWNAFQGPLC